MAWISKGLVGKASLETKPTVVSPSPSNCCSWLVAQLVNVSPSTIKGRVICSLLLIIIINYKASDYCRQSLLWLHQWMWAPPSPSFLVMAYPPSLRAYILLWTVLLNFMQLSKARYRYLILLISYN